MHRIRILCPTKEIEMNHTVTLLEQLLKSMNNAIGIKSHHISEWS